MDEAVAAFEPPPLLDLKFYKQAGRLDLMIAAIDEMTTALALYRHGLLAQEYMTEHGEAAAIDEAHRLCEIHEEKVDALGRIVNAL